MEGSGGAALNAWYQVGFAGGQAAGWAGSDIDADFGLGLLAATGEGDEEESAALRTMVESMKVRALVRACAR